MNSRAHGLYSSLKKHYSRLVLMLTIVGALAVALPFSFLFRNRKEYFRKVAKYGLRLGFFLAMIRISAAGLSGMPRGPAVLASDHRSLIDTLSFLTVLDRPFFTITEPLDSMPSFFIRKWCEILGYIPVIRDENDRKRYSEGINPGNVVRQCIRRVLNGETLLIYPEAHHEMGRGLLKFKTGAVRVALGAKVPLIPVGLTGTERVITPEYYRIHPGRIHIRIGVPLDISGHYGKQDDRRAVRKLTAELREAISQLIP